MSELKLSKIYIYPIKSVQGISLETSEVEERGLKHDRRWMLVDDDNYFITQRKFPRLALINIKFDQDQLVLSHYTKKLDELRISIYETPQKITIVKIWNDVCQAVEYKNKINEWFSEAIEFKTKLVYMPDSTERKTSIKYSGKGKNVSFADGYPVLIIGEESLNNLNKKLSFPLQMNRFRPNIVFSGGEPHDEDSWNSFSIGETKFIVVKPCSRCVLTTVNPKTGIKEQEPLQTLSTYRKVNNKVLFGQNLLVERTGVIKIGDTLKVTGKK